MFYLLPLNKLLTSWQMSEPSRLSGWIIWCKTCSTWQKCKLSNNLIKSRESITFPHAQTAPPPRFSTGTTRAQQVFRNEIFDGRRCHLCALNLSKFCQYRRARAWLAVSCRRRCVQHSEMPKPSENVTTNLPHPSLENFLIQKNPN